MQTIWKYNLTPGENVLKIPRGALALTVQIQYGKLVMWCIVDPEEPPEPRRFVIYGTGQSLSNCDSFYLGTVQMADLVWHVFEEWYERSVQ